MGLAIALVIHSVDPSLSSQLILLLSKIEIVSSTIMGSNTTYAAPAGHVKRFNLTLEILLFDHRWTD